MRARVGGEQGEKNVQSVCIISFQQILILCKYMHVQIFHILFSSRVYFPSPFLSISILLLQLLHQSIAALIEREINKAQPTHCSSDSDAACCRCTVMRTHTYTGRALYSHYVCMRERAQLLSQSNSKLLRNRNRNITVDSEGTRVSVCVCV